MVTCPNRTVHHPLLHLRSEASKSDSTLFTSTSDLVISHGRHLRLETQFRVSASSNKLKSGLNLGAFGPAPHQQNPPCAPQLEVVVDVTRCRANTSQYEPPRGLGNQRTCTCTIPCTRTRKRLGAEPAPLRLRPLLEVSASDPLCVHLSSRDIYGIPPSSTVSIRIASSLDSTSPKPSRLPSGHTHTHTHTHTY